MRSHLFWLMLNIVLFLTFGLRAWVLVAFMCLVMVSGDIYKFVMSRRRSVRRAARASAPSLGYRAAGGQVVLRDTRAPALQLHPPLAPPR